MRHVYFHVFCSCIILKLQILHLFLLFFSFSNFDFIIYFYILVLYSVFGKHKLRSSTIGKNGKTVFTAELLTVANTLISNDNKHI